MIRPDELLRAVDVARLARVSVPAVSQWRRRYRVATVDNRTGRAVPAYPSPWLERGAGRTAVTLWLARDVATWLAATGRDELRRPFEPAGRDERAETLAAVHERELAAYARRRRPHGRHARATATRAPADMYSARQLGAADGAETERG